MINVLTLVTNTALVQILQCLVLLLFVWIAVAAWGVRLRLPKTKFESLVDVLFVLVLLVYAIVFKIIFST